MPGFSLILATSGRTAELRRFFGSLAAAGAARLRVYCRRSERGRPAAADSRRLERSNFDQAPPVVAGTVACQERRALVGDGRDIGFSGRRLLVFAGPFAAGAVFLCGESWLFAAERRSERRRGNAERQSLGERQMRAGDSEPLSDLGRHGAFRSPRRRCGIGPLRRVAGCGRGHTHLSPGKTRTTSFACWRRD